ncbi:MAG: thiamine diphosphokinase [Acidimicrobiales bacterium]|jgi:thiamine pyrophosphokinase|nr:thiamine diphosphokinase [Acidimicrobiales bacterium]
MDTILVFAAGDPLPRQVAGDIPEADLVIAANGGHALARDMGWRVDLLVGDLDSWDSKPDDDIEVQSHPPEKDATDLELAMEAAAGRDPQRIVVIGGSGGRLDHELAVAGVICSTRWTDVDEIDWLSGRGRAHVVRGPRRLHGDVGATLTLLAMGGPATGVTTRGLHWNLRGSILLPGSSLGVSNIMESPVVDLTVESGTLLAVFPGI